MESEYIETNGYEEIIEYNDYDEDYNPNIEDQEYIENSDGSEIDAPAPPPKKRRTANVARPHKPQVQHVTTRTKENCPYCGVGYNLGYLQRHVLIHNTEKNPVCKLCESSVKGMDLWDHYCNDHPEIANQCGKVRKKKNYKPFGSSGEARKSKTSTETSFGNEFSRFIGIENSSAKVVREFKCEICLNALFHMKSDLNNHMTFCHPSYRDSNVTSKFICTICGNSYGNQFYLQEHMECHLAKENKLAVESLLKLDSLDNEEYLLQ